jgi:molybdopterin converting factor small subunit
MEITVRLYLTFRTGRFRTETSERPAGVTAAGVARSLAIRDADVGMVLVNNRQAELEQELLPGDTLSLFPLVGGG